MPVTSVGALIKIIIGSIIGYVLFNYVNILENQALGVGFGFLAVFLIVRGVSYFIFLTLWRISSIQDNAIVSSASYRGSLLLGVYTLCQLALMLVDKRTMLLGVLVTIVFLILQYSVTLDARKKTLIQ